MNTSSLCSNVLLYSRKSISTRRESDISRLLTADGLGSTIIVTCCTPTKISNKGENDASYEQLPVVLAP